METKTTINCPNCGEEINVTFSNEAHKCSTETAKTVVKPSKVAIKLEALKNAGIDTSNYFQVVNPDGESVLMQWAGGIPTVVNVEDPVIKKIMEKGTVPNRSLFRRWVMAQVFAGEMSESYDYKTHSWKRSGFTGWLKQKGYKYMWDMTAEELRVQAKLYGKDMENFRKRNHRFNKNLIINMLEYDIEQIEERIKAATVKKCKGVPYIQINGRNVFLSDTEKVLINPVRNTIGKVLDAGTPADLARVVSDYCRIRVRIDSWKHDQCPDWVDAFKGIGGLYTMENLIRFHDCRFYKDNVTKMTEQESLDHLAKKNAEYGIGEGYKVFGLMRALIKINGIDIPAKRREWREAKAKKA